ncbi:MAG: 50S ribosomal protein L10 [Actinomycetota bacterium]|nr:50S ribosomal protein L10 [Actinomycetota bacterium]
MFAVRVRWRETKGGEGELENPRPEKLAVVNEVRERLSSSSAAILTEYRGLAVKDLSTLRRSLSDVGGDYKIYKNTLVRFAARDLGLDELEAMLTGPTAIAFVDGDAVAVAKALRDFSRTNPALVVKGGLLGASVLSAPDAAALADLPSREVLLARIAGGLAAPMVKFAGLLQALPRNFAYGLKALLDQKGGPPEEADRPADEQQPEMPAPEPEAVLAEPESTPEPEAVLAEPDPAPEPEPTPEPEAGPSEGLKRALAQLPRNPSAEPGPTAPSDPPATQTEE